MNRCALCGIELSDGGRLCGQHAYHDPGWAASNRVICDLLHRGIVPSRLPAIDRDEDLRGCPR